MVNREQRSRGVIVRALIGGLMVLLELPLLSPLIVGTLVAWTVRGVYVLTRRLRSAGHGDD